MSDQSSPPSQSSQPSSGSWPSEADRPMPDQGPVIDELSDSQAPGDRAGDEEQVTLGLENKADDPETARPLSHPQSLVGEEPATGDVPKPG